MLGYVGFPRAWPDGASGFKKALTLFWTIDLLLLGAYVGGRFLVFLGQIDRVPNFLGIAKEYSVPESFNYLKWALCIAFMIMVFLKSRVSLFGCLAVLFAMILVDDALMMHETFGGVVAEAFGIQPTFNIDGKQIGEILIFGVMGCAALALISIGYRSSPPVYWGFAHRYLLVIFGLAIVGVGFDAVHHMTWGLTTGHTRNIITLLMTLLEDGGEMLMASLAVAYSWGALQVARAGTLGTVA